MVWSSLRIFICPWISGVCHSVFPIQICQQRPPFEQTYLFVYKLVWTPERTTDCTYLGKLWLCVSLSGRRTLPADFALCWITTRCRMRDRFATAKQLSTCLALLCFITQLPGGTPFFYQGLQSVVLLLHFWVGATSSQSQLNDAKLNRRKGATME